MLHGGNPVVGLDVGDLTALGVGPDLAGTDVEGPGQAVLRALPALRQGGLEHVLHVVLGQVLHGAAHGVAHGVGPHGQHVPGLGVQGEVPVAQLALQGVALLGQEVLGGLLIGAGAGLLGPHGDKLLAVLGGQDLLGDQGGLKAAGVGAPQHGGDGLIHVAAHAVAAAVAAPDLQHAAGQGLGLSLGHLNVHLVHVGQLLRRREQIVVLLHSAHIDGLVLIGIGDERRLLGSSAALRGGLALGRRVAAAAGREAENHNQRQQQAYKLLHTDPPIFCVIFNRMGRNYAVQNAPFRLNRREGGQTPCCPPPLGGQRKRDASRSPLQSITLLNHGCKSMARHPTLHFNSGGAPRFASLGPARFISPDGAWTDHSRFVKYYSELLGRCQ